MSLIKAANTLDSSFTIKPNANVPSMVVYSQPHNPFWFRLIHWRLNVLFSLKSFGFMRYAFNTVSTWQYWDTSWVSTSHQFASLDQWIPHDQCTRSCLSREHASSTRRSSSTSRSNTPVFNWLPSQVTEVKWVLQDSSLHPKVSLISLTYRGHSFSSISTSFGPAITSISLTATHRCLILS